MDGSEWSEADLVLGAWYRRARDAQLIHYSASRRCEALSRRLGVPSVLLGAAAGTTLFATLQEEAAPPLLRLAVGLVALLGAALGATQTFLGLSERADNHRSAAASYGAIRREIEQLQVVPPRRREDLEAAMRAVRHRLDDIAMSSPDVPDRAVAEARVDIAHTQRPEGFTRSYVEARLRGDEGAEPDPTTFGPAPRP